MSPCEHVEMSRGSFGFSPQESRLHLFSAECSLPAVHLAVHGKEPKQTYPTLIGCIHCQWRHMFCFLLLFNQERIVHTVDRCEEAEMKGEKSNWD